MFSIIKSHLSVKKVYN